MRDNKRIRMEQITAAAAKIVAEFGGPEPITSLPPKERWGQIAGLRAKLEADTDCHKSVSLRHIKAALRLTPPVGKRRWDVGKERWQKKNWPAAKVYVRATKKELKKINRRIPNPRKRAQILLDYEEEQND